MRREWPLILVFAVEALTLLVFYTCSRYRLPMTAVSTRPRSGVLTFERMMGHATRKIPQRVIDPLLVV